MKPVSRYADPHEPDSEVVQLLAYLFVGFITGSFIRAWFSGFSDGQMQFAMMNRFQLHNVIRVEDATLSEAILGIVVSGDPLAFIVGLKGRWNMLNIPCLPKVSAVVETYCSRWRGIRGHHPVYLDNVIGSETVLCYEVWG